MKKMFVAFGIAIAVFCGMIFGTSQTAQAAEVYSVDEIEARFEDAVDHAIDEYSDEYYEMGLRNVDARVRFDTLSDGRVMIMVVSQADYLGSTIYDISSTTASMSEIVDGLESIGF